MKAAATRTWGGHPAVRCSDELLGRYQDILDEQRLSWTEHHRLIRLLGSGGQGVVYLSQRRGTDNFTLPVALKIFSPERYEDERSYDEAMGRMAQVAAHVAQIQQDNLLDVHNWVDRSRIRMMEMEWVNGYDLCRLLTRKMLERLERHVSGKRWKYINEVIVTAGPMQPRLKPGIAIAIVRDCLAALAALHREGIVHGDLKPSNIMLKRTGNAKIVDIGSAFDFEQAAAAADLHADLRRPRGARRGREHAPQRPGQPGLRADRDARRGAAVRRADRTTATCWRPSGSWPSGCRTSCRNEVVCNELLMSFCRGLMAPDPMRRFPSAEAADLVKEGAAAFHRQLVKGDLASEYDNEIRVWLEELPELD